MTTNWRKIETEANTSDVPPLGVNVLALGDTGTMFVAKTIKMAPFTHSNEVVIQWALPDNHGCNKITHWMQLPNPPEGDK